MSHICLSPADEVGAVKDEDSGQSHVFCFGQLDLISLPAEHVAIPPSGSMAGAIIMFIATTWMLMGSSNDFGAMRRELHMADRAAVVAGAATLGGEFQMGGKYAALGGSKYRPGNRPLL